MKGFCVDLWKREEFTSTDVIVSPQQELEIFVALVVAIGSKHEGPRLRGDDDEEEVGHNQHRKIFQCRKNFET